MKIPTEIESFISAETLESLFIDAIRAGKTDVAESLLDTLCSKKGESLDELIKDFCRPKSSGLGQKELQRHPLVIAAEQNNIATIRWLVLRGFSFMGEIHKYKIDGIGSFDINGLHEFMSRGEAVAQAFWFPSETHVNYMDVEGPQMCIISGNKPMWTPFSLCCQAGYERLAEKILEHNKVTTQLDFLAAHTYRPDLLEKVSEKLTTPTLATNAKSGDLVAYMSSNIKASRQAFSALFEQLSHSDHDQILQHLTAVKDDTPSKPKEATIEQLLEMIQKTLREAQSPQAVVLIASTARHLGASSDEIFSAIYRGVQKELNAQKWHISKERVQPIIECGLLSAQDIMWCSIDAGNAISEGFLQYLKDCGAQFEEMDESRLPMLVRSNHPDWVKQLTEIGFNFDLKKRYDGKTLIEHAGKNATMKTLLKSAAAASEIGKMHKAAPDVQPQPARKTKLSL